MNMTRNRTPAVPADALTGTINTDASYADLNGLDKEVSLEGEMSLEELRDSLNTRVSNDINDPHLKRFMADSAFLEEQVLVRVFPSTEKSAEKIVEVWNNGTPQRFIRGEWVIARRKYVEVLARAKPFSVNTPEIVDGNGDRTTRIDTTTGLRYPFEVNDKNPVGKAWLQSILQEA